MDTTFNNHNLANDHGKIMFLKFHKVSARRFIVADLFATVALAHKPSKQWATDSPQRRKERKEEETPP